MFLKSLSIREELLVLRMNGAGPYSLRSATAPTP